MQELACLQRSPTYGLALLDLALVARVTFLSLSQSTRGHMLGSSSAWHRQLRSLPGTLLHLDSPASRLPGRESGCDRLPRIEKVSATPPHFCLDSTTQRENHMLGFNRSLDPQHRFRPKTLSLSNARDGPILLSNSFLSCFPAMTSDFGSRRASY